MPESRDRLTARKVTATDIVSGSYHQQEGFDPNYLITEYGLTVSRGRVLGTVVDRYINDDESYGAITIDDGTDTVRAKFFQDLDMMEDIAEGDIVEVIGKVKEYDGERYINPELVIERGPTYELLRALELEEVRDRWSTYLETARTLREDGKDDEHIVQELQGEGLTERVAEGVLAALDMDAADFERDDPGAGAADGGGDGGADDDRRAVVLSAIDALDDGDGAEYGAIQTEADIDDEEALEDIINDLLSDGTCYEPRPGRIKKL